MTKDQIKSEDHLYHWMVERQKLVELLNSGRLPSKKELSHGKIPLSLAMSYAKAHEARPEVMQAWSSVTMNEQILEEASDLISKFNTYLYLKSDYKKDVCPHIGTRVRMLANGMYFSTDDPKFVEDLLRNPMVIDDRNEVSEQQ